MTRPPWRTGEEEGGRVGAKTAVGGRPHDNENGDKDNTINAIALGAGMTAAGGEEGGVGRRRSPIRPHPPRPMCPGRRCCRS